MRNRGIICFVIIQIVCGNLESFQRNSFMLKLVNHNLPMGQLSVGGEGKENVKCVTEDDDYQRKFSARSQSLFTGRGTTNDTADDDETETPSPKFSFFNLLSDEEEEDNEYDEKVKDEDEEDDDIDLFDQEEISSDKPEGLKGENFLKQYHRQGLRMHNLVFPLLLAYKLKFFTVIPLLLGALVLLVGTTGIAGFFFALFAAALGIHVKTHDQ